MGGGSKTEEYHTVSLSRKTMLAETHANAVGIRHEEREAYFMNWRICGLGTMCLLKKASLAVMFQPRG